MKDTNSLSGSTERRGDVGHSLDGAHAVVELQPGDLGSTSREAWSNEMRSATVNTAKQD